MGTLWQDIRYGLRMLGKNPSFSLIVVVLVAIGVGANTAMFSIFSAFLIRPLPYEKSDRLALVYQCSNKLQKSQLVSHPNYLDWRQQAKSFKGLACYIVEASFWKTAGDELASEYMTSYVSGNFFQVFGVNPSLGRFFSEEDEQPSAACVAVISDAFWRQHFGADEQVIGKTIYFQEKLPYTIVGVAPPNFRYPAYAEQETDIWYPIALHEGENWLRIRNNCVFEVLGRLKAGVEVQQAQVEMQMISTRLAAEYPEANTDMSARIILLQDHIAGGKRLALTLMMGAVGFVFLVACVNLAGLLFARGVTRERELAVRSALGASRFRLVRQLLVENLILACLGCSLGVFVADGAIRLFMHTDMVASMLLPEGFFQIDMRVLGFAVAISVVGIPFFSLLPSICYAFLDLSRVLAAEGRSVLGPRRLNATHVGLVGVEVALTIVLLVASGLLIRSFVNVVTTDPGFNPERILTMDLWLDDGGHREFLQQLQGLQGIDKAALTYPVLGGWNYFICAEGQPAPSPGQAPLVSHRRVTSDYFGIMGIRLLQGRFFDERDHADSSQVAIIDETLANRYWPDGDAIGKHIQPGESPKSGSPWLEIIGIVGNTRNEGVEADSTMQVYWHLFQQGNARPHTSVILRTSADPKAISPAIKKIARRYDWRPRAVRILDQMIGGPSVMRRLITSLLAVFAGIALFLSTIGIYAITHYWVSCRTREFGIRVALGATKADVFRLVFRRGLTPVLVGAVFGLAGTFALARLLSSLLFQLSPWDPVTYASVTFLLISIALLACYLPARRAARIDPMEALRYE